MKNILNVLLITFIFLQSCKKEESLIQQYEYINTAKEAVLNRNFTKADKYYTKALKRGYVDSEYKFTALQLSAKLGNKTDFFERYKLFLNAGGTYNYIVKDSLIVSYLKQKMTFKDSLINMQQEYCDAYLRNIDSSLRIKLIALYNKDQKPKIYYLDSLSEVYPEKKNIYEKKYAVIINSIIEGEFFPLIEKYGYPGEKLTGIRYSPCYGDGNDKFFLFNNFALVTLFHYYSNFDNTLMSKEKLSYQIDLLKEEMKKGNLSNTHYASFIDFINEYVDQEFIPNNTGYYNEWHSDVDITPQNLKVINQRRAAIGLMNLKLKAKLRQRGLDICKEHEKGNYKFIKLFNWCG